MDDMKKQAVYLEDGRKAEKHEVAEVTSSGEIKTVTEVWAEPKIEKKLTQRVVSYEKPVVHRREIEIIDELTGEVVEQKIESIDPEVKMQLREHIKTENSVSAMSASQQDCYVTKADMQQTFQEGFLTLLSAMRSTEPNQYVAPQQISAQSLVEQNINEGKNSNSSTIWAITIGGLCAVLGYVMFFLS